MTRLERIKEELKNWEKRQPMMAFSISTEDMLFLLSKAEKAELLETVKICQC